MIIRLVVEPVRDDFFTLSGADIPDDAVLEFTTPVGVVTVRPNFIRPHLALVERLPATVPPGAAQLRMTSPTAPPSNALAVTVAVSPPQTVRLLQAGDEKPRPYTIAFVANPSIEAAAGGSFQADPILTNRPGFHAVVGHCFHNLFLMPEDLLRRADMDARMRMVSVFDTTLPADAANSLTREVPASSYMQPRREVLSAFLSRYGLAADVVIVIHASVTHTDAVAWHTTDDEAGASTTYIFNNTTRRHGHFPRIPGSVAISVTLDTRGLTVLHEFCHAASDFNNGRVEDLYYDGSDNGNFTVNKKFRASPGDPVPGFFGAYEDMAFASAPTRGGRNYPTDWRSFHPQQIDGTRPNLMDNYWETPNPQRCRLDSLTRVWLDERLRAKLGR